MIHRFEEISNNAWPALQNILYDGWILRFAGGVTKRSNSVSMLFPSKLDPVEKIRFCENLCLEQKIIPCFKVTAISDPENIDSLLENDGYFIHSSISFQTIDIQKYSQLITINNDEYKIVISSDLKDNWIDQFIRMNGFDISRKPVYVSIMNQVLTPKCLISIEKDEKCIAVGLGVLEDSYIGIFDLVVHPDYRQQNHATTVINEILLWGKQNGADTAYLQVLTDNFPALALYKKLGFMELYRYWYRMKKI